MRREHEKDRNNIKTAYNNWRIALTSFDTAPPSEAYIASLELEAAERRYMLALSEFGKNCDTSEKEDNLCLRSTSKYPISGSRAVRL